MDEKLYRSIDHNMILNPVAYCKSHHCYLSKRQMKVHQCTRKHCTGLKKLDCSYWQERQQRKNERKKQKQKFYNEATSK